MPKVSKTEWKNKDGDVGSAWIVRYSDQAGRRRAKQFKRKRDAELFASDVESAVRAGTHVHDRDSITVTEAAEIWLAAVERGRDGREPAEPATLKQYGTHVRLHIEPLLGSVRLNRLTTPRVVQFRDELLDGGRSRELTKKVLASLHGICSEARTRGHLAANPVEAVGIVTSGRHKEELFIPSKAEVRGIVERTRAWVEAPPKVEKVRSNGRPANMRRFAPERARWFYLLVRTAVATGMRLSELRGLSWRTVDLKSGWLDVEQRADERGKIGPTKTAAGRRRIDLPADLLCDLREWKLACPKVKRGDKEELDLVLPNLSGKPETATNIYRRFWHPLMEELGLVERVEEKGEERVEVAFGFHALRHFRASVLIETGADVKEVQRELGHASAQMTLDTYGHLFDDEESNRRRKSRAQSIDDALFASEGA